MLSTAGVAQAAPATTGIHTAQTGSTTTQPARRNGNPDRDDNRPGGPGRNATGRDACTPTWHKAEWIVKPNGDKQWKSGYWTCEW